MDALSSDEVSGGGPASLKVMRLHRPGRCACGVELSAGDRAAWDRVARTVWCLGCVQARRARSDACAPSGHTGESEQLDRGVAGGSADDEFARRHQRREEQIRQAHPRLGGLILALSDDPQSTTAWQSGAIGERRLAGKLADLGDHVVALHDRRVPGSRANIDHVVIGAAGVYVIDAKRYRDAVVKIRLTGGLIRPAREQLLVSGRDKTALVTGMRWQVDAVRTALHGSEFENVPCVAVLCFIDAELPLFSKLEIGGVRITGLRAMAKLVATPGPVDPVRRGRLARHLAAKLPAKITS